MNRLIAAASLALALVPVAPALAADPTQPIDDPIPGHIRQGPIRAQLQVKAFGSGLTAPLYGTFAPGPGPSPGETTTQPNILYVVDQDGPLWAIDTKTGAKRLFIDTRQLIGPIGAFGPGTFDERGFLGVAFHPDYQVPGTAGFGVFYTTHSDIAAGTNADVPPDHFNVLTEWRTADPLANPLTDASDAPLATPVREVFRIGWPQFNHNGSAIFFGTRPADRRLLYLTTGDGGCADDQNQQIGFRGIPCDGHGTGSEATVPNAFGNGQNPDSPWGKIFRFDPLAQPTTVIPAGNDVESPLPMYAFGLRNPWRASSDRFDLGGSGDVWLSDVGQNDLEEVDHVAEQDVGRPTLCPTQPPPAGPGQNFGWHVKEGTFAFNPFQFALPNPPSDGFVFANSPCAPAGMTDPIGQYDHDEGTAGIGGFVYRGDEPGLESLRGRYVFGDYSRRTNNGKGSVFLLDERDTCAPKDCTPRVKFLTNGTISGTTFMEGFGEDAQGNIWALANETGIPFGDTGLVMKLVRNCADDDFVNGEPGAPDCRD
jgi:hypothetical protein